MKRLLLFFLIFITPFCSICADDIIDFSQLEIGDIFDNSEKKVGVYFESEPYWFVALKNKGTTQPMQSKEGDLRVYAKGTLEVINNNDVAMTKIVFAISKAGKKRLADITSSSGNVFIDNENWTVTWAGNTTDVLFTIGDYATHGTEDDSKAGQFCINTVTISTTEGSADENPETKYNFDVNGDGIVDVKDVSDLINHLLEK